MKKKNYFLNCSLIAISMIALSNSGLAAIRVGNSSRSYAEAYNQVNAMQQQAQYYQNQENLITTPSTDVENNLPVRVANSELVEKITSGGDDAQVIMEQLERCSMIYPNGEFAWDSPSLGHGIGGGSTCVAVVEMRGSQMGVNGSDVVLARANLAAGDSVKCNISEFPDVSYTADAGKIEFPADNEPTIEDVKKVMNEEQKQNAVLKIAAGAILGGLGGNISGENDPGKESLLGTDKGKVKNTVIGALGGAALMAGNTYAGKVGGDIILSTGVNAAAGAVAGNIMASGESVLRIENCTVDGRETSCLWGSFVEGENLGTSDTAYYNIGTGDTYVCNESRCYKETLMDVQLEAAPNKYINDLETAEFNNVKNNSENIFYFATNDNGDEKIIKENEKDSFSIDEDKGSFLKISSAKRIKKETPAVIPDVRDKAFGMKESDWKEWKKNYSMGISIYARNSSGQPSGVIEGASVSNFYPMKVDAEDGGLIDLNNKARLKATLTGAGIGGAMGAFSAYQGAQSDIQNRWTTAVREYKDSLQKIYCVTGDRFLSFYNDIIEIPSM